MKILNFLKKLKQQLLKIIKNSKNPKYGPTAIKGAVGRSLANQRCISLIHQYNACIVDLLHKVHSNRLKPLTVGNDHVVLDLYLAAHQPNICCPNLLTSLCIVQSNRLSPFHGWGNCEILYPYSHLSCTPITCCLLANARLDQTTLRPKFTTNNVLYVLVVLGFFLYVF